jgi:hypothetical protein
LPFALRWLQMSNNYFVFTGFLLDLADFLILSVSYSLEVKGRLSV